MPRNLKGGNKAKKGANKNLIPKAIVEAEEGQYYGIVTKYNGAGRCELTYVIDNNTSNNDSSCQELKVKGILRGSLKKKMRLNNGDIILITPRDYQSDVVDIINKYSNEEIQRLRKSKIVHPNLFKLRDTTLSSRISTNQNTTENEEEETMTFGYEEEDEFGIHEEPANKNKNKSYNNYSDIYKDMPSFSSDEEED
jgi:initiation factor 1A